jgi:acetyltransferase-like isoleucine patch superfamily enzyme
MKKKCITIRVLNILRNLWLFRVRYPWVSIGRDVHCKSSAIFWAPHRDIRLGDHVGIGHYCHFTADTRIGSKVLIASFVSFINSDDHIHDIVGKTMWDSERGDAHSIEVEDDVWIGQGAIIMSPCRIGRGSIVAAGSVVKGDVQPYTIVGGVLAKKIRNRFTPDQIAEHERLLQQK